MMFGNLKRLKKNLSMTKPPEDLNQNNGETKGDTAFILAIIILGTLAVITVVKAFYDPVTRQQLKNIKLSAFDIIAFAGAVIGYFVLRKRRKK